MSKALIFIGIAAVVVAGGLFLSRSRPAGALTTSTVEETIPADPAADPTSTGSSQQPLATSSKGARRAQMDAGHYSEKVILSLTNVTLTENRLSPGQAEQLRQSFHDLAAQGVAALPVIRQLLENKQDVSFGKGSGETVGAPSLRLGLLDTLRNIGGPAALALSRQDLSSAPQPHGSALLTLNLDFA